MEDVSHDHREAQRAAYGEPLSETFARFKQAFGLNQAALAEVLGLSAPMLSQLNSAQRVKIGNPAVLNRVHQLNDLAAGLAAGDVSEEEIPARLQEVRASKGSFTRTTQLVQEQAADPAVVAGVRNLLRAVASGAELREAAELLAADHPKLAEVLRLYGTGPVQPALEHYAQHKELF